jgi:hypothetical protein
MKHFLSFANKRYYSGLSRIGTEALNCGYFDVVNCFTENNLPEEINNYANLNPRGYGFWIWKPFLISEYIKTINYDDIVVYCDAGCHISIKGKNRYEQYLEMLKTNDLISFELPHLNQTWTKPDVFEKLNSQDFEQKMIVGGIVIFKKTESTIKLFEEWFQLPYNDRSLIDDSKSILKNGSFKDHRHDQSIYSLIVKKYNPIILEDETYMFSGNDFKYPFNATRWK